MMILLLLWVVVVDSAPMRMFLPLPMPVYPGIPMVPMDNGLQVPINSDLMNQRQMLFLLPNDETAKGSTEIYNNSLKSDYHNRKDDTDSVVIDSESEPTDSKVLMLLPNGRFSIGDFISSIPWLPIEVNVPDSISWAYNGISSGIAGIISIIGQRWPFQRPVQMNEAMPSLMTVMNRLQVKKLNNGSPMVMMPMNAQFIQIPIQV
ncbi:unnamed protein product [Leptidea sinapis]|uniref:Uncharacterized protein n=1 Tax=Leptidea sinapis TaxID=189913 RepID=A0A5E4PYC6_9NEOP|nr:unnamed protein product [Leptidea sinapis]